MLMNNKILVVMPAYNAERTLLKTYEKLPKEFIDEIVLVDDASTDNTVKIANELGITVLRHDVNKGYGANQKTCYSYALKTDCDIITMIHPDYQYDPAVLPYAAGFVHLGICDIVIGSRVRSRRETLNGGMPLYKYLANRFLTTFENIFWGQNLGDFHSGFRIYHRKVLEKVNFLHNSDNFVFDTELLAQAIYWRFRLGDVPIPTKYDKDSSSINFPTSVKYGILSSAVLLKYMLTRMKIIHFDIFD
jgi:glycosyltransferase involved in cell wall biosynthesis